jgi:hypothetical protein
MHMMNSKKTIMDFWYEFDLLFNPGYRQVPPDINQAYRSEVVLLNNWLLCHDIMNIKNYPDNFIERINEIPGVRNSINILAENQLRIINGKLGNELIQKAFEYFGQGVLFDNFLDDKGQPRRPDYDKVHMMDTLHFGYPRWHVFCRSAVFTGHDHDSWLKIDRLLGLAYALHTKLTPQQSQDGSDPQNPERPDIVKELLPVFTTASFDQLDEHFDNKDVRGSFGHL